MRRLVPPHLEVWQPATTDASSVGEEYHLLADGAVLLLDAEGSTELSARLRAHGTLGAEPLDELLDQIFARVVDAVVAFGGYVGHFTGDGVIAAFPGDTAVAVQQAVAAARTILEHLGRLSGIITPAGPVELAVRAVVGAGTIDTFVWRARSVTNVEQQNAAYVVVGSALAEAQTGEVRVVGGALGVGPRAVAAFPDGPYLALSEQADGSDASGSDDDVDGSGGYLEIDLTGPHQQRELRPPRRLAGANPAIPAPDSAASSRAGGEWRFVVPEAFDDSVQPEFRYASVLFLELREWPHEDTVAVILERAAASGGHISNVLRTTALQRGITFMLLWGAPTGHTDDAARALGFVEAVQRELGIDEFRTGAVYSNMFIGFVGSDAQSTYTAIGAPVNLASRLCSLADWGEIRVTEVFDDVVPPHWTVESVAPTRYKGFNMPLATRSLRPSGAAAATRRRRSRRRPNVTRTPSADLVDEPTSGLGDPQTERIADALADLQARAAGNEPTE
jgi:class 3 adenylate cyclase